MKLDMHCHTVASDGKNTVEELISTAKQNGLEALFITDHDRVSFESFQLIQQEGIFSIPSVEITTVDPERLGAKGKDIHMTYYSDQFSQELLDILARKEKEKQEYIGEYIIYLQNEGFVVSNQVFYGTYHIAKDIVQNGNNREKLQHLGVLHENDRQTISTLYKRYLNRGGKICEKFIQERGNEYFKPHLLNIAELVEGKGVLSFAHPNYTFERQHISGFLELYRNFYLPKLGISAIEINTKASRKWVDAILGLQGNTTNIQLTFGSDCHELGNPDSKHGDLGFENEFISEERVKEEFGNFREKIGM